jgi:putative membrane-bound dehydrogenase-like protein
MSGARFVKDFLMKIRLRCCPSVLCALLLAGLRLDAQESTNFPPVFNTQNPASVPLPPIEAAKLMKGPPGFNVSLFAGEPDVQQPIGITTDDRGRLWVAENYTYAEARLNFDLRERDRVIILEDTGHTGHFDKRTIFWDQGQRLTSVAVGFGGVWVLCAPQLLFIPTKNRSDVPAGPPVAVLDGWNDDVVRHNIVNGLFWGPDGWLYGRHGIQATSYVGKPGAARSGRTPMNAGIWRYHPTRKVFEVVAQGTTNPWGFDYNAEGEMFFINTVIGHLWHLIPGAHYKRMYGDDFDLHTYDLLDQHADHYHFDTGKGWTASRNAAAGSDPLGGGHAHEGLMFYLGDNWPSSYYNTLFTVNFHGRRLNNDIPERVGSGYSARHGADLFKTDDIWFRGLDLIGGPDGGVFLSDWSDVGECHNSEGIHRTSGRIYKLTYGQPAAPEIKDVAALSTLDLCRLQTHKNDWFTRHARRILQERAAAGEEMRAAKAELLRLFDSDPSITHELRFLWSLYVIGGADESWLLRQLHHPNEHVRAWAVRLLIDRGDPGEEALREFVKLSRDDPSGLVRLYLSSALQRLPAAHRVDLAAGLLSHAEDANDHNLPLMIWYGIEPIVGGTPDAAVALSANAKIPLVRRYTARWFAETAESNSAPLNSLLKIAFDGAGTEFQSDMLQGMSDGWRGWRKAPRPNDWDAISAKISASSNAEMIERARTLSVLFGDGRALDEVRAAALSSKESAPARLKALQILLDARPPDLLSVLEKLVQERTVGAAAVKGLMSFNDPSAPALILRSYEHFSADEKPAVIEALITRPDAARQLLQAVAKGKVHRSDLTAFHARQIQNLGDDQLSSQLREVWGEIRGTGGEKRKVIDRYRSLLTPDRLQKADPGRGRVLFTQTCAVCHVLYGEGARIGPDLTGAGRDNLEYLLENIVDPSAIVGADFRVSIVTLKDGRVLNGILRDPTAKTLTIQSPGASLTVERTEVAETKTSLLSLMPEGILEALHDDQIADLIRYLESREQVPLPPSAPPPTTGR